MKCGKCLSLLLMVILTALLLSACAKAPEAERSAAKAAMGAALSAGAQKYAANDYTVAWNLWSAAETQVKEKRYEQAKITYAEAQAAFAKVEDGIAAARTSLAEVVKVTLVELEEGWKNLEALSKRSENKMTQGKGLWEFDVKTFLEGLQAAKEMTVTDPAAAKEKTVQLRSFLDNYTALFNKSASAPTKPEPVHRKSRRSSRDD